MLSSPFQSVPNHTTPGVTQTPTSLVEQAKNNLVSTPAIERWVRSVNDPQDQILALINDRKRRETKLLADRPVCPSLKDKPAGSVKNLGQLVDNYFFDSRVMAEAYCTLDSNFVSSINKSGNRSIRRIIGDLKRIGAESVAGVAMISSLTPPGSGSNDTSAIVKTTNDIKDSGDSLHEFVVGTYGTNKLRQHIPNYAYILGGFMASPPYLQEKEVITYAEGTPTLNYVLYENIAPSVSAADWIPTASLKDFITMFYQVALSLWFGFKEVDFTHYDLHTDNVLIRKPSSMPNILIPYPHPKYEKIYVMSDFIATIIDYGCSHIRYQGQSYGNPSLRKYGVLPDRSFPMHDIYKFLMAVSLVVGNYGNTQVYNACEKIFRFFNKTDDFAKSVNDQRSSYYSVPAMSHLVSITHSEFIEYFESTFAEELNQIVTIQPRGATLSCDSLTCYADSTIDEILFRTPGQEQPVTVLDVFEKKMQIDPERYAQIESDNRREAEALAIRTRDASQIIHGGNNGAWLGVGQTVTSETNRAKYMEQLSATVKIIDTYNLVIERLRAGLATSNQLGMSDKATYYSNTLMNYESNYKNLRDRVVAEFMTDYNAFVSNRDKFNTKQLHGISNRMIVVYDFIKKLPLSTISVNTLRSI